MALATNSTPGSIVLGGDLTGTATAPELRASGVIPGSYSPVNIIVDAKGRIVWAKQSSYAADILPLIPEASYTTKGICQVYQTTDVCNPQLVIVNGELRLNMQDASDTLFGKVTVDAVNSKLEIVTDGLMKVKYATSSSKGIMQAGSGLSVTGGVLTLDPMGASGGGFGVVQIANGGGIDCTAGVLSYNYGDATDTHKGFASFGSGITVANGHVTVALPNATTSSKGIVQVGSNIDVTSGVISLSAATTSSCGLVKIGTGLATLNGVLTIGDASTTEFGVVQLTNSMAIDGNGVWSLVNASTSEYGRAQAGSFFSFASNTIGVNTTSASVFGAMKVGSGLSASSGVVSLNAPTATSSVLGLASFGAGLAVSSGHVTLNAPFATTSIAGQVIVGTNINVSSGNINVDTATDTVKGIASYGSGLGVNSGNVGMDISVLRRSVDMSVTVAQTKVANTLSGVSVTPNGTDGNIMTITTSADVTLNNMSSLVPGAYYHFIITNAHVWSYGSMYKFKTGAQTQPIGTNSVLSCYAVDASTLYCIMQPNFA